MRYLAASQQKDKFIGLPQSSDRGSMCRHPHVELSRVPRLHKHRPRPREFANQAFSTADARNDAPACYTLHDVFAVPSHKVTVIDDVLLTFDELHFH